MDQISSSEVTWLEGEFTVAWRPTKELLKEKAQEIVLLVLTTG
jgi:hypothetical protein